MKILITGATGFLGRNFLDFFMQHRSPLEIVCLIRSLDKAEPLKHLPKPVVLFKGDLLQPETLKDLPNDFDRVFHIAALVGLKNGAAFYDTNVNGTQNLLDALGRQKQLQRILQVSSIAAMDRPLDSKPPYKALTEDSPATPRTDYGKSKLQAEVALIESGLPYTILRPAYIYGPYPRPGATMDRVIYDVQNENPYTKFPFPGHASEMYASDLAELMWISTEEHRCTNQIYCVANPEPVNVQYFFKTLSILLKKSYRPYPIPRFLYPWLKKAMLQEGLEPILGEILFHDYFAYNPAKLYQHLSYRPYYGFEAGLTRTIQWYRQQKLLP